MISLILLVEFEGGLLPFRVGKFQQIAKLGEKELGGTAFVSARVFPAGDEGFGSRGFG